MIFLIILFLAMGSVLIARLFDLQVLNGESYLNDFTLSIRKERVLKATRGEIYDCNGKLLAYNQLAYSVTLEDVGTYRSNTARNLALNGIIYNTIRIIESHGDSVLKNFRISLDKDGNYVYNTSGFNLNRFKADIFGRLTIDSMTDRLVLLIITLSILYLITFWLYGLKRTLGQEVDTDYPASATSKL